MDNAVAYGVGNWHLYYNNREKAKEIFELIASRKGWASFGYIAAEADLSRM